MHANAIIWLAVAAGLVVLLLGVLMRIVEAPLRRGVLPHNFRSPVVAMQMARSMRDIEVIVGGPDHSARLRLCVLQWMDFLFIGAYWLALVSIGLLSLNSGFSLTQALGTLLALFATLTALFDVRENVAILKVLDSLQSPVAQGDARPVRTVNVAATRKWYLFSVTMYLLSIVLIERTNLSTTAGLVLLLSGLLFLVTSGAALIGSWRRDAVLELTAGPMVLGLILLVSVLFCFPEEFL